MATAKRKRQPSVTEARVAALELAAEARYNKAMEAIPLLPISCPSTAHLRGAAMKDEQWLKALKQIPSRKNQVEPWLNNLREKAEARLLRTQCIKIEMEAKKVGHTLVAAHLNGAIATEQLWLRTLAWVFGEEELCRC